MSLVGPVSGTIPIRVGSLEWLTPVRCRLLLALVLTAGFALHLFYLASNPPLDLAGDEAQYWDWSRQPGLSYYSKGPMVAWIIRGSCLVFGDQVVAVRLPALLLAAGTLLLLYGLTSTLFGSERLGLIAVLLPHLAPLFVAGSLLMTVDAPLVFCWTLATLLAALALFRHQAWAWPAAGAAAGAGFLAKYDMVLWFAGVMLFLFLDSASRPHLKSRGLWLSIGVASMFSFPVLAWNAVHGWVTVRHVVEQTGLGGTGDGGVVSLLEFLGSQVAVIGVPLAILILAAVFDAVRRPSGDEREKRFLLCIGLPLMAAVCLSALLTKPQANWAAPVYCTLLVLASTFLGTRPFGIARRWRRLWTYPSVAFGVVMWILLHHSETLYPWIVRAKEHFPELRLTPQRLDPSYKLRGWTELGAAVSEELDRLGRSAFILTDHYQTTAEMAFYVTGRPNTYYAGSYFHDPSARGRLTQYDLWVDRSLDSVALRGRDAIYVGEMREEIRRAFESVQPAPPLKIVRGGVELRTFQYWRCFRFMGMQRPPGRPKY